MLVSRLRSRTTMVITLPRVLPTLLAGTHESASNEGQTKECDKG